MSKTPLARFSAATLCGLCACFFSGCEIDPSAFDSSGSGSYAGGGSPYEGDEGQGQFDAPGSGEPWTARPIPGGGGVEVYDRAGNLLTQVDSGLFFVEEYNFINNRNQLVVKSRGRHGPATVQLFDSRTGRQIDEIFAYEVTGGRPAWAAPYAE